MTSERAPRLDLLPPRLWQPLLDRALAPLPPELHAYARELVYLTHSRHVGATPELIAAVVPLLLRPGAPCPPTHPWHPVTTRLHEAGRGARSDRDPAGPVLLCAAPSWSVLKLVLPLLARAHRRLPHTYLFCEEPVRSHVSEAQYAAYHDQAVAALADVARADAPGDAVFWQERALTLSALTRAPEHGRRTDPLPEMRGDALSLLLRVRTEPEEEARKERSLRQVLSRHKQRPTRRAREGGFSGIQLTRRPEDLEGILLSEFTNPDALFTDRLLNTGYFALERAPRRSRLKDVYVAAVMPRGLTDTLAGDFVKACWFDCMALLGRRLRTGGLDAGAFSWLEGDQRGRLHRATFSLEQLPKLQGVHDGPFNEAWRREFMTALGWIPHYFSPRAGDMLQATEAGAAPSDQALAWSTAAWKQVGAQNGLDDRGTGAYSFLHLMLFLPTEAADTPLPDAGRLMGAAGLAGKPGRNLSITRVPTRLEHRERWAFLPAGEGRPWAPSADGDDRQTADALVTQWLNQFTKEIWRG